MELMRWKKENLAGGLQQPGKSRRQFAAAADAMEEERQARSQQRGTGGPPPGLKGMELMRWKKENLVGSDSQHGPAADGPGLTGLELMRWKKENLVVSADDDATGQGTWRPRNNHAAGEAGRLRVGRIGIGIRPEAPVDTRRRRRRRR